MPDLVALFLSYGPPIVLVVIGTTLFWSGHRRLNKPAPVIQPAAPASSVEAVPAAAQNARHYSDKDKDRISELFFQLKELIEDDVRPLDLEIQSIWTIWNQRANYLSGTPLPIDETLQRVVEVAKNADALVQSIYVNLADKYKGYTDLISDILTNQRPLPIHNIEQEAWHFRNHLLDFKVISENSPSTADHQARLVIPAMNELLYHRTKLSAWIADTLARIKKYETEILGG